MDTVATLAAADAEAAPAKPRPQSIQIGADLKDYLKNAGRMGDTYEDVIRKEISRADRYQAAYMAVTWDCMDIHVLRENLQILAPRGEPALNDVVPCVPSAPFDHDILDTYPQLIAADYQGRGVAFSEVREGEPRHVTEMFVEVAVPIQDKEGAAPEE